MPIKMEDALHQQLPEIKSEIKVEDFCEPTSVSASVSVAASLVSASAAPSPVTTTTNVTQHDMQQQQQQQQQVRRDSREPNYHCRRQTCKRKESSPVFPEGAFGPPRGDTPSTL